VRERALQFRPPPPLAAAHQRAQGSVLQGIHDPATDLVLWTRGLPPALVQWLDDLPESLLPDGRILVGTSEIMPALRSLFRASNVPPGPISDLLLSDIARLAHLFARIIKGEHVDIRVERVHDDGCKRFHRDYVPFRLLTTYRGPSTQWVPSSEGEQAISQQHRYTGPILDFPTHSVALFRGATARGGGIVHRSPPIRGSGITRLVLSLNLPSSTSPQIWRKGMDIASAKE